MKYVYFLLLVHMPSIVSFILSNWTLAITFPGTDNRVIPLQLLQSNKSPFFGSSAVYWHFSLNNIPADFL